jgi:hypothetical protein
MAAALVHLAIPLPVFTVRHAQENSVTKSPLVSRLNRAEITFPHDAEALVATGRWRPTTAHRRAQSCSSSCGFIRHAWCSNCFADYYGY